jgi:hypothetical protein
MLQATILVGAPTLVRQVRHFLSYTVVMKKRIPLLVFVHLLWVSFAHAHGTFRNLGFESAQVPDLPANVSGGLVSISTGMPGWSAYLGNVTRSLDAVLHNDLSIGSPIPSILGPITSSSQIIEGNFTACMRSGPAPGAGNESLSLAQTGHVPAGSRSQLFKIAFPVGTGARSVSLGGIALNTVPLESTGRYTLYGADVSEFADQTEELRFTAVATGSTFSGFYLDSIQFSPQAIPEPGSAGLLLASFGVWVGRRWLKRAGTRAK